LIQAGGRRIIPPEYHPCNFRGHDVNKTKDHLFSPNRRRLLVSGAAAVVGLTPGFRFGGAPVAPHPGRATGKIPLIHTTDLYHPPQDPDDHFDLATVAALDEYDLRGVILDVTRKFLVPSPGVSSIQRDPGFVPVTQLGYLLGRTIPVASGPSTPLSRPDDDAAERGVEEQGGIRLLLAILEESPEPVVISVAGSSRVLTAAFNRHPDLVRRKVRSVLLNAGSTSGPKTEWNVGLDPHAYAGLWRSGLPIHWFPCATESGGTHPDHERGTFWKASQRVLLGELSRPLRAWFSYALTPDRSGAIISALDNPGSPASWETILAADRNMWCTASLIMEAGRVLAQTPQGWRFIPAHSVNGHRTWGWRLDRIEARGTPEAGVRWEQVTNGGNAFLFGRERGPEFAGAMAEALSALLGTLGRS
jgi:hypothetical protein